VITDIEVNIVLENIKKATMPEELFGDLGGTKEEKKNIAKHFYRLFAKHVHPDVCTEGKDVFPKLNTLLNEALDRIERGVYGTSLKVDASVYKSIELNIKGRKITLTGFLAQGAFTNIYDALYEEVSK
jgi:hypothetical protein